MRDGDYPGQVRVLVKRLIKAGGAHTPVAKPLGLIPGLSTSEIVARIHKAERNDLRRAG